MFFRRAVNINAPVSYIARRFYKRDVALIGCPFGGGQPKNGVEDFPKLIREREIVKNIESLRRKVIDCGDVEIPEYSNKNPANVHYDGKVLRNTIECGVVAQRLAKVVEDSSRGGNICVTLGGDHSVATGSIIGHSRASDVCVLWIDAHNDMNTYKSTPSGNPHGMSLSFVVKGLLDSAELPGYEWTKPCLHPRDLAYIGLRDTDPEEYLMTTQLGITTFSMYDVDRYGISQVVERAIERINPKLDKQIHVSFDVDSLDPLVCPGTGTPVPGGLSLREALYIGEYINKLGLLGGLDIVEVNPSLCNSQMEVDATMHAATSVIEAFLGKHRSGYIR